MEYHRFKSGTCKHCGAEEHDHRAADKACPDPKCETRDHKGGWLKSTFEDEGYGSFEVFYNASEDPDFVLNPDEPRARQTTAPVGWYWWACFPGCLPDGDPQGPFATEQEAIDNAQEAT